MNIEQKKKLLQKIVALQSDIETLKKVRLELISSGYASASMSSGAGSKSYTRLDVDKVTSTISQLQVELKNCRKLLKGMSISTPTQTYTIYSFGA